MDWKQPDPPPAGRKPPSTSRSRWRRSIMAIIGLSALLGAMLPLATAIGSVDIPFMTTANILLSRLPLINPEVTWPSTLETIIIDIRLPRVILAGVVGAALSVAGATYQGLFRNPLADPYLLGVAQGASVGAVAGILLPVGLFGLGTGMIPVFAFLGALGSASVVYFLARTGSMMSVTRLILSGVALGALLSAIVSYLITISDERIHSILFWLMGSFSLSQWSEVRIVLPVVAAGVTVLIVFSRALNLIQLGKEQAEQLGINVEKLIIILLVTATLVTAAAVSFVGIIGFVGIIIPHMVRLIWGPDYRFLLPLSLLTGGIFLIVADIAARTLMAPTEIPVGIFTALCGAPFFLYLLKRRARILM